MSVMTKTLIIRFQEKNSNLNRDSNLGSPDLMPGALSLNYPGSTASSRSRGMFVRELAVEPG